MAGARAWPVKFGEPDRNVQALGQEGVFLGRLVLGNEDAIFLDQSNVMIPGRVLEVAGGEIGLAVEFLFMVELGGLVGGGAAPGGNPWWDDFAPQVAAFELVGTA
jgi:hypothetical protein